MFLKFFKKTCEKVLTNLEICDIIYLRKRKEVRKVLNTRKLKAARVQAGVSIDEIAKGIGRNPATIYRKFDGKSEFTVSELIVLKDILHLDMTSFCDIFFNV